MNRPQFAGAASALLAVSLVATAPASAGPLTANLPPGTTEYHVLFATTDQLSITTSTAVPPSPGFFGGLDAADWFVTLSAFNSGLLTSWNGVDAVYTAILSTPTVDARDRFAVSGPIVNTNGDLIALDFDDLWDGSIINPVGYDEYGNAITGDLEVWTGTSTLGYATIDTAGPNWNSLVGVATTGSTIVATSGWIGVGNESASSSARLYGISPAIVIVPEPSTLVSGTIGAALLGLFGWRRRRRTRAT